jgi:hypothetical protein
MAAGLAVTAAALAASGAGGAARTAGGVFDAGSGAEATAGAVPVAPVPRRQPPRMVSAPVRIADAATVRLLRRGDRVDVIAAPASPAPMGGAGKEQEARIVASGARVTGIPGEAGAAPDGGALIVLSVPRATAAELAGASATSQLAVTVC